MLCFVFSGKNYQSEKKIRRKMRAGASGNNVLETINAAASAFASSDDRVHHQPSPIHVSPSPFSIPHRI